MASILDLMNNVRDQAELGKQEGKQTRLGMLAGRSYSAPQGEQAGILGEMARIDRGAAAGQYRQNQGMQQDRMAHFSQKAKLFVGMAKSGNQAAVAGMYPQLAAEARELTGAEVPLEYNESFLPGIEQFAMMGGATGDTIQSQKISDDGYIVNTFRSGRMEKTGQKVDRQAWFRDHEGMAPQIVQKDGSTTAVGGATQPQGYAPPPQMAPPRAGTVSDSDPVAARLIAFSQQLQAMNLPPEQQQQLMTAFEQQQDVFPTADVGAPSYAPPQMAPAPAAQARPSAAQTAAEVARAKGGVELEMAPALQAVQTQGKINEMQAESAIKPTKAQEAVDTQYGKEYVEFLQGGAADANKALLELGSVLTDLDSGENMTGPLLGMLPNAVKTRTNPRAMAAQETVESTVQRSLRVILGAQFTEKEGERLIARAYNPSLPEEVNKKRVRLLYNQLKEGLANKAAMAKYYETNGTLRGFTGKIPSLADFDIDFDSLEGGATAAAPSRAIPVTNASEYNAVPSGATYIAPDGTTRRKP